MENDAQPADAFHRVRAWALHLVAARRLWEVSLQLANSPSGVLLSVGVPE